MQSWPWWIRTTINGSKVRCPAIGRRASASEKYLTLAWGQKSPNIKPAFQAL
jgi:hypothetical protein